MIQKIVDQIKKWDKIAFFHHINPDGDSISCSYGFAMALKEIFPNKKIVVVGDWKYLNKNFSFLNFNKKIFKKTIDNTYLTIIGDTSVKERIVKYEEYSKGGYKICFDHHQNSLNIVANIFWHKPNYPASALQTNQILDKFQQKFKENTSIMLMFGILTDTGFFKYSTNNHLAPLIFSKRLKSIKHETLLNLYSQMFSKTKKDLQLLKIILDSIEYKGTIAYVVFNEQQIKEYGVESIKWKINSIGYIKDINIWAFFLPNLKNKNWEAHLRSIGPKVNEVAKMFGGGGHFRAAGIKVQFKNQIYKIINELVKKGKLDKIIK